MLPSNPPVGKPSAVFFVLRALAHVNLTLQPLNLQGPNPSRDLVLGLLDTGGRETVLKGVRIDVEWILRS